MSNSEESVSAEEDDSSSQGEKTASLSEEEDIESGDLPEESASAGSNVKEVAPKKASVQIKKTTADKKPVFMNMIIEAITENGDKKGTSVPAIKTYMQNKYSVGESSLKANLKKNILKAIESDIIYRANSSKDSKGLRGRFKVNPEYLKTKRKEEKEKQKKASMAAKKSALAKGRKKAVKKPRTVSVNGKELKSLGEKSYTVKVAKEKIKQARKSIGMSLTPKPAVPRKKILAAAVRAKTKASESGKTKKGAKTKDASASKSPKAAKKPKANKKSPKSSSSKGLKKEDKPTAGKKKATKSKAGETATRKEKTKKK